MMQSILVTGGAGFIATNLIARLLSEGFQVTSIDNMDDYYSRDIKVKNSLLHQNHNNYKFLELDLLDRAACMEALNDTYDAIIHLAARPGVRFSIQFPEMTSRINTESMRTVLDIANAKGISKIIYASSSSIYGINKNVPWTEESEFMPISPYAESKIKCEEMGKAYAQEDRNTFIALRFFSVYGKYARPDLAIGKFAFNIMNDIPIPLYGDGQYQRDFTYVDDIVNGILLSLQYEKKGFEAFNLGNTTTKSVMEMIRLLEVNIGKKAMIDYQPVQKGDVPITYAEISKAQELLGYQPSTSLEEGIKLYISFLEAM
ncbi:MAG: NAD-dependent epimerase/dehydratase family protein [Saprospiraceae bacterium]|nr:NAD-dependent epimerase/dehydratase family protein [Saprospiraceae bacterium]